MAAPRNSRNTASSFVASRLAPTEILPDVRRYRGEFEDLLKRAIRYARGRADRVLVLSIPDWGVTPFVKTTTARPETIAAELDTFNAAAQVVCEAHGVAFVDITPVSRERGGETEMLAEDGLHPSAAMYELWTGLALPVARELLSH